MPSGRHGDARQQTAAAQPTHQSMKGMGMNKTKLTKTRMLMGVAGLAAAVSTVTLSVDSGPARAIEEGTSCAYGADGYPIPVGTEVVDGDYTIVIKDGKLYHRHGIYKCGSDRQWQRTGYVDLETEVIGCCPKGGAGDYGEILN
jgi:hypothetical protein